MSFYLLPTETLIRPCHIYGAPTPEYYLEMQRSSILRKKADFPFLNWRMPFAWSGAPAALKVSDAHWQVQCCECANTPAYDPDWQLAACFTCGAIYRQAPPTDWRAIERVLVCRPYLNQRHMLIGQTLAELVAENVEHGDPIPEDLAQ